MLWEVCNSWLFLGILCNGKNVLLLPFILSVLLVPSSTSFRRCGGTTATHHHLPSLNSVRPSSGMGIHTHRREVRLNLTAAIQPHF